MFSRENGQLPTRCPFCGEREVWFSADHRSRNPDSTWASYRCLTSVNTCYEDPRAEQTDQCKVYEHPLLLKRIKLLEAAGNDMAKHAEELGMGGTGLVRRWKEANP